MSRLLVTQNEVMKLKEIIRLNWYSGHFEMVIPNFFPTTKTKIRKVDKLQKQSDITVDGEVIYDFWDHILHVLQDNVEECQLSLFQAEHDYKVYGKQTARREMQHLQTRIKKLKENITFIKGEYCNGKT